MGNSSSTNVFLSVNGSRTCITAGSTVSGEIRCPDHSISNDIFSGVTLYFIGKEDVEVRSAESGANHGYKGGGSKSTYAKRDIVRQIIPLDTSRSSVEAGHYPFQFHIPDQLPSSMHYKDAHGGYAAIRYKIKLHLMRGRDQEIPIVIVAKPPSTSPVPSLADPMLTRIQFCYCMPAGSMTWAAGVDNTRVGIGENLNINLGMKNESLAKLERISAKLKQTVEYHTSGHSSTNKSIVRSSSFSKTDSMTPRSKDQLRLKSRKGGAQQAAEPLTVYEEVLTTTEGGHNQVTFPIPEYVCQSYAGRLIKIRHYVSIKATTPAGYTKPKIHIPIEIVSPGNTPIVTAHAIPVPTAPPIWSESDEFPGASYDAPTPHTAATTTFVVGAVVNEGSGEEEFILGSVKSTTPSSMPVEDREAAEEEASELPEPTSLDASCLVMPVTITASAPAFANFYDRERSLSSSSPPAFDSRLIAPLLGRDELFDSGRV